MNDKDILIKLFNIAKSQQKIINKIAEGLLEEPQVVDNSDEISQLENQIQTDYDRFSKMIEAGFDDQHHIKSMKHQISKLLKRKQELVPDFDPNQRDERSPLCKKCDTWPITSSTRESGLCPRCYHEALKAQK